MRPISRKKIIFLILAVVLIVSLVPLSLFLSHTNLGQYINPSVGTKTASNDPAHYVDPFIGTDAAPTKIQLGTGYSGGSVFPGAGYPQGMVQWSPDTTTEAGGYHYTQPAIYGFSLTHFSGRGCSSYQDIPFMPTVGPLTTSPATSSTYASTFSHRSESASPGYYRVHLDSSNIDVALTVTLRSGLGQFTYPRSQAATMLINAGGSATGNSNVGTGVQIVGSNQVTGSATSGHFCGKANTYRVYFAATFDHPFTTFGTWNGPQVNPKASTSSGQHSGAYVTFDTTQQQVVQVKVGLSFVSVANAQANLAQENPAWNFQTVQQQARAAWNARLSSIQITGGTSDEQRIFYTALYHCFFHPNVFSDVNGQYLGFDHRVHVAQGYTQYENFAGWDMYRSLIDLLALLEPRETSDMMQSLVADAQQGGGGLPRWEVANDNSAGMVGDSPDVIIAKSYAFGARNFDTQAAWQAMDTAASQTGIRSGHYVVREGLKDYLHLGYVPTDKTRSASTTLEYAIDDFAIAQFAQALGKASASMKYLQRARNWRHLFNPATGYLEPRNANGTFVANFSPTSLDGFAEGDAAQYTWLVPQDMGGLFTALGGNAQVIKRLDALFTQLNAGPTSPYAFMGNEPSFELPWEYDAAGAASRTQQVVRRIQTQLFTATPTGLPDNDDGGAMSSWYVFSAMGLYPQVPGVAGFLVGSPLFSTMTVHLGNGTQLQIIGQGASDSTPYVQSLRLGGQDSNNVWIPFSALQNGATLQFTLGSSPNTAWGSDNGLPLTPTPATSP